MRRLLIVAWVVGLTAAVGATLIGCPAAHEGYPTTACNPEHQNADCFVGEICDPVTSMCTLPPSDMSVLLDLPYPDFRMPEDLAGSDGGDL